MVVHGYILIQPLMAPILAAAVVQTGCTSWVGIMAPWGQSSVQTVAMAQ